MYGTRSPLRWKLKDPPARRFRSSSIHVSDHLIGGGHRTLALPDGGVPEQSTDLDGVAESGTPQNDEYEPSSFVTVWRTAYAGARGEVYEGRSDDDQIRLPLLAAGTYDFEVRWGDGTSDTIERHDDPAVTHTYDEIGEYQVVIDGRLEGWSFCESMEDEVEAGDARKLVEIRNWGDFDVGPGDAFVDYDEQLPSLRTDLMYAENLTVTADDEPVIESGNSLAGLFAHTGLTEVPGLANWDLSYVNSTWGMFWGNRWFDGDVSEWDVSSVENMGSMFRTAWSFDGDLSAWDVSNVKNMSSMFRTAKRFDGDVSNWDVSNVETMWGMFNDAEMFDCDLSGWDVSNVEDMGWMFRGASIFDGDVSEWDVSSVRNMRAMFCNARTFNGNLSEWNVSNVEDMHTMFQGASAFDGDLSAWDVSNVETMRLMFEDAEAFTGDVSQWDVSHVEDMRGMFRGASSFDCDLSRWDVSRVKDMEGMLEDTSCSRSPTE